MGTQEIATILGIMSSVVISGSIVFGFYYKTNMRIEELQRGQNDINIEIKKMKELRTDDLVHLTKLGENISSIKDTLNDIKDTLSKAMNFKI